jgi:hypothetical protein
LFLEHQNGNQSYRLDGKEIWKAACYGGACSAHWEKEVLEVGLHM